MTVLDAEWRAVAYELGISMETLAKTIAKVDEGREALPRFRDRKGDLITLGEWSMLYGAFCYRYVGKTTLPNGRWVATVWIGGPVDDPAMPLFESSVFPWPPEEHVRLGPSLHREEHESEAEAMERHGALVAEWKAVK